jgi:Cdc6-like AAA superfamily ATPase
VSFTVPSYPHLYLASSLLHYYFFAIGNPTPSILRRPIPSSRAFFRGTIGNHLVTLVTASSDSRENMLSADRTSRPDPLRYLLRPKSAHQMPSAPNTQPDGDHIEHIWIITGPAGCGKTTVAQYLAKELSLPYVEGDDVRHAFDSLLGRR